MDTLLKHWRSKAEAAAAIKAQCVHADNKELEAILDILLSPYRDIDDKESIEWLIWLMAGGSTPDEFSSTVKHYDDSPTCGVVWPENSVAYRCKTCEISPFMSLCRECYENGDHQGHDVLILKSETGGACDCGEINLVKPSGCCYLHRPQSKGSSHKPQPASIYSISDHEQSVPSELLCIARAMIPRLFLRLIWNLREESTKKSKLPVIQKKDTYSNNNNNNNVESLPKRHNFIQMLQRLSRMGVAMKRLMIQSLTEPHAYQTLISKGEKDHYKPICQIDTNHKTFLDEIMYWTIKFEFPKDLMEILLRMKSDPCYNEAFFRAFILHYRLLAETILQSNDSKTKDLLCKHFAAVSVQIFSIQDLALKMTEEAKLLHIVMETLHDMIQKTVISEEVPNGKNTLKLIDCDHEIIKDNLYWPIKADLNMLLSHPPIAIKFFEDDYLLGLWFDLLSQLQGMKAIKYIEKGKPHVEEVSEEFIVAVYTAETQISCELMTTLLSHLKDKTTANITQRIIQHCWQRLKDWTDSTHFSKNEVSFYLPLHRNLSMFIHQGVQYQGLQLIDLIRPDQLNPTAQQLIRLMSSCYQIAGNLWIRNGDEAVSQVRYYKDIMFCNSIIDADIFLLQIISSCMPRDEFLEIVFHEFRINEILALKNRSKASLEGDTLEPNDGHCLLESFLLFLTTLASFRTHLGMPDESLITLEMSTLLCFKDRLHSDLILPERFSEDPIFEETLSQVADFIAPNDVEQGKYIPKPTVWDSSYGYDPIHVLLRTTNRSDFQDSLDRFQEYAKGLNKYSVWPPFRIPKNYTKSFPDPRNVLSSIKIREVLFEILYNAVHLSIPDLTLQLAIYILELEVSDPINDQNDSENPDRNELFENLMTSVDVSQWEYIKKTDLPTSESIISLLLKLYSIRERNQNVYVPQTESTQLYEDAQGFLNVGGESRIWDGTFFIRKILDKITQQNPLILNFVLEKSKSYNPSSIQISEKEIEEKRRKVKERQMQLSKDFEMKRQAFINNNDDIYEENNQPSECDSSEFICLSCQEKCNSKSKPYGVITFINSSSVLSHKKPLHDKYFPEELKNSNESFRGKWTEASQELTNYFDKESVIISARVDLGIGTCIQTCGHYFHTHCFENFIKSVQKPWSISSQRGFGNLTYPIFNCPLCRQLGNSILPIITDNQVAPDSSTEYGRKEPVTNSITRLLKKRSTVILSSEEKQAVDRFIADVKKTLDFSRFISSNVSTTTVLQARIGSVFLDTLEMEEMNIRYSKEAHRSCILPLYSVLKHTYKLRADDQGKKLSKVWEVICGTRDQTASVKKDVPILLRDINLLLTHLTFQLPHGTERKVFHDVADKLSTLRLVQILSDLCLQLQLHSKDAVQIVEEIENKIQELRHDNALISLYRVVLVVINRIKRRRNPVIYGNKDASLSQVVSSTLHNPHELKEFIYARMRVFLQKVKLLKHYICPEDTNEHFTHDDNSMDFFIQSLLERTEEKVLRSWITELMESFNFLQPSSLSLLFKPNLVNWDEPRLVDIPHEYNKIFQDYTKIKCPNCRSTPLEPALCLACGTIVSRNNKCCYTVINPDDNSVRTEVIQHSIDCGIGTSIFLCILSSKILVIVDEVSRVWGSVFLDSFGEQDLDLLRGRPLYLSEDRYKSLQRQWVTQSFLKSEDKWPRHNNMS